MGFCSWQRAISQGHSAGLLSYPGGKGSLVGQTLTEASTRGGTGPL